MCLQNACLIKLKYLEKYYSVCQVKSTGQTRKTVAPPRGKKVLLFEYLGYSNKASASAQERFENGLLLAESIFTVSLRFCK